MKQYDRKKRRQLGMEYYRKIKIKFDYKNEELTDLKLIQEILNADIDEEEFVEKE